MLTIGTTVLGVGDVPRARQFWCEALGYVAAREPDDDTFIILVPASGTGARLALDRSESEVQLHPRIHLDLYADDQAAEIDRLLALGAQRVDWDLYPEGECDFVVLADPDGNRFCVIDAAEFFASGRT
jgi:catechol 2,3-dioxygenase-like lactoylglutathione lyase family enzyme